MSIHPSVTVGWWKQFDLETQDKTLYLWQPTVAYPGFDVGGAIQSVSRARTHDKICADKPTLVNHNVTDHLLVC